MVRIPATMLLLFSFMPCLVFTPSAAAQQNSAMGEVDRSIGDIGRGVGAEGSQSRPASSGGSAPAERTPSARWNPAPGSVSLNHPSTASGAGSTTSWAPARNSSQAAASRLSMLDSTQKPAKARQETASKEKDKGAQPHLPSIGVGVPQGTAAVPFQFTGKVRYESPRGHVPKTREREKWASSIRARSSPSKRKHPHAKPRPEQEPSGQQQCQQKSKLQVCTWL